MLQSSLKMLKYIAASGVALTCILGFQNNAFGSGNFSNSCGSIRINRGSTTLRAVCRRKNGTQINTSLNLNPFIGNVNGKLTWGSSNFALTCGPVNLINLSFISTQCRAKNGNLVTTTLNLNEKIANDDGRLTYRP